MEHIKCAYGSSCHIYQGALEIHDQVLQKASAMINGVEMDSPIQIQIALHFVAPPRTINKNDILERAQDMILALNEDFNGYSANNSSVNNFRYRNIINRVFASNPDKRAIYSSPEHLNKIPRTGANITFELGQIYYYPIKRRLNLEAYRDDPDAAIAAIHNYIISNRAVAIMPEYFLNMWVVDIANHNFEGLASFPWHTLNNIHGIILSRSVFHPSGSNPFNNYRVVTHQVGHYLGLPHITSLETQYDGVMITNYNIDPSDSGSSSLIVPETDPTLADSPLQTDPNYHPLFTNFMSSFGDKYVTHFSIYQIQKMRYMIKTFRTRINHLLQRQALPAAIFDPELGSNIESRSITTRIERLVPRVNTFETIRAQNVLNNLQSEIDEFTENAPRTSNSNRFVRARPNAMITRRK